VTTITVKDSAGLVSALKAAKAGDVVQLAAGNYSNVTLSGLKFAGTVTITSQDPNHMAVMNGFTVKDSDGLKFQGLEMNVDPGKAYPYQVWSSNNVTFDGVKVHGTMDDNPHNDVGGVQIRNSTNVTVSNSEFQQLEHGISHLDSNGITVNNNYFHDLRTDGVRGGGSSKVTVKDNFFTDFDPAEGDHPDAIQLWTTNTTKIASDIVITGNVVVRGEGSAIQGVFLRDQVGGLPFTNVTISNNMVVGGLTQGIGVVGGQNVTISNNTVVGLPDQRSSILTNDVTGTVSNNTGTHFRIDPGPAESGNKTVESPTDGGKAVQTAWLLANGRTVGGDLAAKSSGLNGLVALGGGGLTIVHAGSLTGSLLDAAAKSAMDTIEATRLQAVKLTGTDGADRLAADGVHDTRIEAGAGDDMLYGGGVGHNTLIGGAGNDKYVVQSEYDNVVEAAGGGTDVVTAYVDYSLTDNVEELKLIGDGLYGGGNALDNKITGSAGDDEIRGNGGNDALFGGSDGNDRMFGGDGNDTLSAGLGNDTLSGDAGNDKLSADDGNDSLSGGAGADTMEGGAGADTLSGGAGADMFVFREGDLSKTPDRITDFSRADGDRISVASIDANVGVAGDQKFAFIGTSAFHHVAGELRFDVAGGVTTVYGDTNGDGAADFSLVLPGAGTLQATDFLL
jgi:parallel beta-helix repeat protein